MSIKFAFISPELPFFCTFFFQPLMAACPSRRTYGRKNKRTFNDHFLVSLCGYGAADFRTYPLAHWETFTIE